MFTSPSLKSDKDHSRKSLPEPSTSPSITVNGARKNKSSRLEPSTIANTIQQTHTTNHPNQIPTILTKTMMMKKHPLPLQQTTHKNTRESGGEFKTIEEYIEFVLTEILREDEPEQAYTPEEEEEIKERLRKLEYIQ